MFKSIFFCIGRRINDSDLCSFFSCSCKAHFRSRHSYQISKGTDRHIFFQCQPHRFINKSDWCYADRASRTRDQFHLWWQKFANAKSKYLVCMCSTDFHDTDCRTIIVLYDLPRCSFFLFSHYSSSSIN